MRWATTVPLGLFIPRSIHALQAPGIQIGQISCSPAAVRHARRGKLAGQGQGTRRSLSGIVTLATTVRQELRTKKHSTAQQELFRRVLLWQMFPNVGHATQGHGVVEDKLPLAERVRGATTALQGQGFPHNFPAHRARTRTRPTTRSLINASHALSGTSALFTRTLQIRASQALSLGIIPQNRRASQAWEAMQWSSESSPNFQTVRHALQDILALMMA